MEAYDFKMIMATALSNHISQNDAFPVMKEAAIVANAILANRNVNTAATATDVFGDGVNEDGLSEFSFSTL